VVDRRDVELLMVLQYDFPLSPNPYEYVGRRLGMSEEEVLERARRLLELGFLKRVGAYVNYRSEGLISALIGAEVRDDVMEEVLSELRRDHRVTHCYERDHEVYNMWFVVRARGVEELKKYVELLGAYGVRDCLVLLSKRTCKLSVRFDLWRGISWSPPQLAPERVPTIDELGIGREFVDYLRRLPLEPRPYLRLAESTGVSEEHIVGKIKELIESGVLRDFGAALDGEKLGFNHNAMVLMKVSEPLEACRRLALEVPEATHVVLRETLVGSWDYNIYVMVHSREKSAIDEVVDRIWALAKPLDYVVLYSRRNLKFVVR